jgi:hypothetical protein
MRDINKIYQENISAANAKQTGALARAAGLHEEATKLYLDSITQINKEHLDEVRAAETAWHDAASKKLSEFDGMPVEPAPKRMPRVNGATELNAVDLERFERDLRMERAP